MEHSPLQVVQTVGLAGDVSALFPAGYNRLLLGDCLPVMAALPAESFDVIYLDPPFFTGQERRVRNDDDGPSYSDDWDADLHGYLTWLQERMTAMRALLKPEGALFVHLDWHAVHYVKVQLDHLFGARHFQNEFIWYYSGGGASRQRFARKHDTVLYYTKSAKRWKFHADRVRTAYKWTDGQKRADGSARDYTRGKLPDDVWEHHGLLPWAEESVGYPTQKPAALLERLLLATTDDGDVVGDFFCGSGTTAVAAQRLGRRWVTADASRMALCLAAERVAETLAPGCLQFTARRARARARERYAALLADPDRLGLDPSTLTACTLGIASDAVGFTVEQLTPHDVAPSANSC